MSTDLDRRLRSLFARGVVRHADVKAGLAMPQAEFLKGELRRVELPQGYGFASVLLPGSEIFAVFANGERDAGVGLSSDDRRYRGKLDFLESGDTALYGQNVGDANGHQAHMTNSPKAGTLKIKCARIELRAADNYVLIDSDPSIGMQKGTYSSSAELPLNPGGAPL